MLRRVFVTYVKRILVRPTKGLAWITTTTLVSREGYCAHSAILGLVGLKKISIGYCHISSNGNKAPYSAPARLPETDLELHDAGEGGVARSNRLAA